MIYSLLLKEPVTIVRSATLEDYKKVFSGPLPKEIIEDVANGERLIIIRRQNGFEFDTDIEKLRADGGLKEIKEALAQGNSSLGTNK